MIGDHTTRSHEHSLLLLPPLPTQNEEPIQRLFIKFFQDIFRAPYIRPIPLDSYHLYPTNEPGLYGESSPFHNTCND